jgi:hypothetical protein
MLRPKVSFIKEKPLALMSLNHLHKQAAYFKLHYARCAIGFTKANIRKALLIQLRK